MKSLPKKNSYREVNLPLGRSHQPRTALGRFLLSANSIASSQAHAVIMINHRSRCEPTLTILPADPFNGSAPLTLKTMRCVALSRLEAAGRFLATGFPRLDRLDGRR
jgi:hypothetical protein